MRQRASRRRGDGQHAPVDDVLPPPARSRLRRLTTGRPAVDAVLVLAALVVPLVASHHDGLGWLRLVDLTVYRDGGESVLVGRPVYEQTAEGTGLPFTYPPLAALLAVPLALTDLDVARWASSALGLAIVGWVCARCARPLLDRAGDRRLVLLALLVAAAVWLYPVRETLRFGQVNLVLLALVLADLTARSPRWPRGALVGLAMAIKLTPGIFVPYLWLSGRRRAAVVAAGTAAGLTVAVWLVAPGTSRAFWLDALLQPERLGDNDNASNQSLRGMLMRAPLPEDLVSVGWVPLAALVALLGLRRAVQAHRAGDEVLAVGLVGLLAVLCSPVAWMHHLVWLLPLLAAVLSDGRDRGRVRLVAAVWALFTLKIVWWCSTLLRWDWSLEPLWWIGQNAFGLGALALLLLVPIPAAGGESSAEPTPEKADAPVERAAARA